MTLLILRAPRVTSLGAGRVAADRLSRRRSVGLVQNWAALKRELS